MTKKEVYDKMYETLTGKGYQLNEMTKSFNGVERRGIAVKINENIWPVFYPEDFVSCASIDEAIQEIVRQIKSFPLSALTLRENMWEYEICKTKIVFRVINKERNEQILKDFLYIEKNGLLLEMRIEFCDTYSMRIPKIFQEKWKVSKDELVKTAFENTARIYPPVLKKIGEAVADCCGGKDNLPRIDSDLWVLSNKENAFGAVSMFLDGCLKMCYEKVKKPFWILPSSIHELILMPHRFDFEVDEIKSMVHDINENEVSAEDYLSDNIYLYHPEKDEVEVF